MKYDFSELNRAFGISPDVLPDTTYENVVAVTTVSLFQHTYLVKLGKDGFNKDDIMEFVETRDSFLQKHCGEVFHSVEPVKSDSDVVKILQRTEQPTMTLENFTKVRNNWLPSLINKYSKL